METSALLINFSHPPCSLKNEELEGQAQGITPTFLSFVIYMI